LCVERHAGQLLFCLLCHDRVKPALVYEKPVSRQRVRKIELLYLVRNAQAGDSEAMEEICLRFTGLIKKYAFQPHIRPIAEEAQSQGWLALVQGIRKYDEGSGIPFAGYMESQVKYAVWNLFKRERRRWEQEIQLEGEQEEDGFALLTQLSAGIDVAFEVEIRWLSTELTRAVATLPSKQAEVIMRTVVEGEALTKVAAELGITPQGIYNLRKRGLTRLKMLCTGMYRDVRQ